MKEEIKNILKENHLYDDSPSIKAEFGADYNKIDEFLKTYKQNPTNKQKIDKISRDNNGRIVLDDIPFIKSNKSDNKNNTWLILNNGTKLLVKKNRKSEVNEAELLIMYFIKQLNMACANYDIATFKDNEYLVCSSFLRNNEKIINVFKTMPNINDGYELMRKYNGQTHFIKTCFIDRIYGNIDRFPLNYGVIKGNMLNKKPTTERLCPLFDNASENSTLIRNDKYGFFPYINNDITSCLDMFKYFLDYEEIITWLDKPFKKANLYDAAKRLYKDKDILINNDTYKKYESFFKDSESLINEALKDKGKSFKIKIV